MPDEPQIEPRPPQPYLGLRTTVGMAELATEVPPLVGELFGWLGQRGITPAGAPFWRYAEFQPGDLVELDVGVPVSGRAAGDERIHPGVLPGGRYATSIHVGHPTDLAAATAALLDWGKRTGVEWDVTEDATSSRWAARLEIYHTDPDDEPDLSRWRTELAIKLAD